MSQGNLSYVALICVLGAWSDPVFGQDYTLERSIDCFAEINHAVIYVQHMRDSGLDIPFENIQNMRNWRDRASMALAVLAASTSEEGEELPTSVALELQAALESKTRGFKSMALRQGKDAAIVASLKRAKDCADALATFQNE